MIAKNIQRELAVHGAVGETQLNKLAVHRAEEANYPFPLTDGAGIQWHGVTPKPDAADNVK